MSELHSLRDELRTSLRRGGPLWLVGLAHGVLTDVEQLIAVRTPSRVAVAAVRAQARAVLEVYRNYRGG